MKKIILPFLFLSTICAFSQSKTPLKTGKEVDDKSFVKFGNKKILEYDGNTIFFTTGNSIGKLAGNHLEAKYAAGRNNSGKIPILYTTATDNNIVQVSFSKWKLAKLSFSKTNLTQLVKGGQIIKDYKGIVKGGSDYNYLVGKSKNREYTAISLMVLDNRKNVSFIDVFLFDANMNLVRENRIKHSFGTEFISMKNISVSNTGDILLGFGSGDEEKRKKYSNEQIAIALLTPDEEEYITVPLNDNHLMDYIADFDHKGDIYVAGYFCTANRKATTGTFSFFIDKDTKTPGELTVVNFPSDYKAQHPTYMPYVGMVIPAFPYLTKAHEIIFVDDHNAYLVGYEYALLSIRVDNSTVSYQFSRNVILTKLNSEAQAEKVEFIEMSSQALYDWNLEPKAFSTATDEGKLYLIYVDHAKNLKESNRANLRDLQLFNKINFNSNEEACIIAIIAPDEPTTKKVIYDNSSKKTGVLLTESLSFDPEKRCYKGFIAEKRALSSIPSSIGLKTVEITLP